MKNKSLKVLASTMVFALAFTVAGATTSLARADEADFKTTTGKYMAGDFHTHTFLTDGSNTESEVVNNAFNKFGLDWMANSEHGGTSKRDPYGNTLVGPIWRWVTLKDMSYPIIQQLRQQYNDKLLVQGVEWNVPSHEHASVGIVAEEPTSVSDFEYMFDASDKDTSRTDLSKSNKTHVDAVAGAKWLQTNYKGSSYFLLNHPSRVLAYSIADIRDFNNAAPDVAFGFEGIPGHQREGSRGGYGSSNVKAQTYGGADLMIAQVGGLWDALLGEGRQFFTFINSDFHSTGGDFWPGEYGKSYTWVNDKTNYKSLVAGLRSGNSFAVEGDLINALDFKIKHGDDRAIMGETLTVDKGDNAQITIRFKSPSVNNNGDAVKVDHIDLIAGDVTGKAQPGTPDYNKSTNDSTKIIARFTSKDWEIDEDGYYVMHYILKKVDKNQYFRLRGTNQGLNVANETDANGNPLVDSLMGTNDSNKAYQDMWFYSNPVFMNVE